MTDSKVSWAYHGEMLRNSNLVRVWIKKGDASEAAFHARAAARMATLLASQGWTCKARGSGCDPEQECDWPFCGCDPYAEAVLEAIEESGMALRGESK